MKGQLPLSVGGLGGQRVEQFGRSEAFLSLLILHLPFLDHVHGLDPDQCVLGRCKRLKTEHGTRHPLHASMVLLYYIIKVFDLTDDDGGAVCLVVAGCDRSTPMSYA